MSKMQIVQTESLQVSKPEEVLTDVQLMERLQIKKTTLILLMNREDDPLPCSRLRTKPGRTVPILRFRWSRVEEWLERQE